MESQPEGDQYAVFLNVFNDPGVFSPEIIISLLVIAVLLFFSSMISGSETAFFSLSHREINELKEVAGRKGSALTRLLNRPRYLLATILITNNLINIAIVVISYFVVRQLFAGNDLLGFLFNVVVVTFLIVLFGEVIPKVYASQNNQRFARMISLPLFVLLRFFRPLSTLLVKSTMIIENKLINKEKERLSREKIDQAIDLAADTENSRDEVDILKGIVKFGDISVTQIMCSHVDMVGVEYDSDFESLLTTVRDSGYSRIPVFREDKDNIVGILYAKDLLSHLDEQEFEWQALTREAFFVPESKKIDDLLKEFQLKRIHMAIVVDEYGGTSGLVTLEDILEEIIGEIQDEFDESQDKEFTQLDPYNYIFMGKVLLNDVCKVMELDSTIFDKVKGEADTLAGLILELAGKIPAMNEKLYFENFMFTVLGASRKRIERIKITLLAEHKAENED